MLLLGLQAFAGMTGSLGPNDPMREIIVLAACGAHEVLPQVRAQGALLGTIGWVVCLGCGFQPGRVV